MITSAQNEFIKNIIGLKQRKNRDRSGLFTIEGEKFVNEVPSDWDCELVISESFSGDVVCYGRRARFVSNAVFRAISDTVTPQGILAVVKQKEYGLSFLNTLANPFILLCEDMQDPGNLGTLLRTADAANCDCVILTKGSVDIYNPKVLRATAGSVFHIPIIEGVRAADAIACFRERRISVFASSPSGGVPAHELSFSRPCAIMIGNEARGLESETITLADYVVRIPMPGRAESLNASAAAAMLVYEVVRQQL